MTVLCFASRNKKKVEEFGRMLGPVGITLVQPRPEIPEPEENGATFLDNASIKARAFAAAMGMPAVADDSGIVVPVLSERFGFPFPGVLSARISLFRIEGGELLDFDPDRVPEGERTVRNRETLQRLVAESGVECSAYYRVSVVVAAPDGTILFSTVRRSNPGVILTGEMRGDNGFAYDPILLVKKLDKTYGEMTAEEKDAISHRGRALRSLAGWFADKSE